MVEATYFERLKSSLEGLERCQYDDEHYWRYSASIIDLQYEAYLADISLNDEQESYVREAALEHLKMGIKSKFLDLCSVLAYTGSKLQGNPVSNTITHHFDLKMGCPKPFDIAIDLLKDAGIFEPEELVRYYDIGTIGIQKKDVGRSGLLILTDRRIIGVGGFTSFLASKRHKLFYGDLKAPYLSTVDFICFNRAKEIELKKKEIRMKYDTEYLIEKDRTFYGPYFFKFDLPTSVKVKAGIVKVIITIAQFEKKYPVPDFVKETKLGKARELWNSVEVPKDYDQVRLETFFQQLIFQGPDIL